MVSLYHCTECKYNGIQDTESCDNDMWTRIRFDFRITGVTSVYADLYLDNFTDNPVHLTNHGTDLSRKFVVEFNFNPDISKQTFEVMGNIC